MDEFFDEMDDEQVDDLLEQNEEDAPRLYEHFRFVADRGQSLLRVDKFLVDRMMGATRNRIQLAADAGCIMANGKPVKSNYRVKPEDVVTIMMSRPRRDLAIIPENIPIKIIYEDDDLLVVDKPAEAKTYLTSKGFVVRIHDVIGVELKDEKGNLNRMLTILADGEINVNYIYSFVIREGKAPVIVFHTDDFDKAQKVLEKADVKLVEEEDL